MNKFLYLFITLFAIGFSSCSKDDVSVTETGEQTTLKLTVSGIGVSTKSHAVTMPTTGDGTVVTDQSNEANINRITVAVFKAASENTVDDSDPVDVISEYGALTSVSVKVTSGNRSVLVVANAPAGAFDGVTTRGGFLSKVLSLDLTAKGVKGESTVGTTQSISNLPMEGEITYATGTTINTGATVTASVILKRLVARVAITKIVTAFSGAYSSATFTPESVFLYNANNSGTWGTNSFSGLFDGSTASSYLQETISDYSSDYVANPNGIASSYYFYTFPNSNTTSPTKLVIKGTFDPDGGSNSNAKPVYYPIVINLGNSNTSGINTNSTAKIEANKAYNLTATIKGEGSTGPSVDITPVNLTVDVTVQSWTAVAQNVTFN